VFRFLAALAGPLVMAVVSVSSAAAAPCGPATCAPLSSSVPGARTLFVRPEGQSGPLVAYDLATAKIASSLPAGVLSADGRRFVAAVPLASGTRVLRFDAVTGKRVAGLRVAGWRLRVVAVSADGRYAALVTGSHNPEISVVDLDRTVLVRKIALDGDWAVDALSRDGLRLYLLEYGPDGSYRVRVHDAARGLVPGAITDPKEPEPMAGVGWSSIGTRDGSWQLTLYLKSGQGTQPFVHALSLLGAHAACIDLPAGDFIAAGRYALLLAPNGRTLYAANPSLGVVATIDLRRRAVVSVARFPSRKADDRVSAAFGAVAPDGRTVYFTAGAGLLAYDVATKQTRSYRVGAVAGVGVDMSGRALLVVRPDGTAVRLDARTGLRSTR
jgi:DNA-binding beta-propeller fold protein YncE